jgi:hypothetical protein
VVAPEQVQKKDPENPGFTFYTASKRLPRFVMKCLKKNDEWRHKCRAIHHSKV